MPAPRPPLAAFLRVLLKHASFTVGGGSITTVALEQDLVEDHNWLTREEFRQYFGLARLTPGTNLLALITGLGYRLYSWPGALAALAIGALPGAILAAALAAFYQQIYQRPAAQQFLSGTAAAVCGLIGASVWKLLAPYTGPDQRIANAFAFALFLGLALFGVPPLPVFLAAALAGYFLASGDAK